MKTTIKISSIIIAKNEEHNIRQCIESQLKCIDDIVLLVDVESSDQTFEIASSYDKVNCEKTKWQGYSKTKQLAVDKTDHEWVLWIDADEVITKELSQELINFKNLKSTLPAYSVARRAYFLGKWIKHSGWYPGRVTRLFNKNKCRFSDSKVHEHLIVDGEVGKLNKDLEHYTDPNIFHYFQKLNRYTTLAAGELDNKNRKAGLRDLFLRPPFIFLKMYILRKGFLDGLHGFILAIFSSTYVFVKYLKLWELYKVKKQ